ncbi:MAG: DUF1570 domain-containing protein [Planctomycetaceae bacterium]
MTWRTLVFPLRGLVIWLLACTPVQAGGRSTVELTDPDGAHQGMSLAHDAQTCWLLNRQGVLQKIDLRKVTAYCTVEDRFKPETVIEARDRYTRQVGTDMEVTARGKYVVIGPTRRSAECAQMLEQVYNEFWSHFSKRQLDLQVPEFPLVVLIFPTQKQFAEYARKEGVVYGMNLKGYYSRNTNRIALFAEEVGRTEVGREGNETTDLAGTSELSADATGRVLATVAGDFRDTLIHEAIHQLAYNTGLHSRIGDHPRWLSEGLAMLFEEDSRRDDSISRNPVDRVNRSRYLWFMNYRQERRPKQALEEFILGDQLFRQSTLDAYSESWALSFYLIETRRAEYRRYLQLVGQRDPLHAYTADERRADFQAAFGADLNYLEGQYLRYFDQIGLR